MGLDEAEKLVLLAQVAERAERFDEMADFMKALVEKVSTLNTEQRDMFSAAFKCSLSERRQAVRVAVGVAETCDAAEASLAMAYKSKVEAELKEICEKALALLSNHLVPTAAPGEDKTFYLKMMGDYYRYMAEFAAGDARTRAAQEATAAYQKGLEEAGALSDAHPVRLGLALNFSVFQHEVLQDTTGAVVVAKEALVKSSAAISSVPEDAPSRSESIMTMQLLQENLALWDQ